MNSINKFKKIYALLGQEAIIKAQIAENNKFVLGYLPLNWTLDFFLNLTDTMETNINLSHQNIVFGGVTVFVDVLTTDNFIKYAKNKKFAEIEVGYFQSEYYKTNDIPL